MTTRHYGFPAVMDDLTYYLTPRKPFQGDFLLKAGNLIEALFGLMLFMGPLASCYCVLFWYNFAIKQHKNTRAQGGGSLKSTREHFLVFIVLTFNPEMTIWNGELAH